MNYPKFISIAIFMAAFACMPIRTGEAAILIDMVTHFAEFDEDVVGDTAGPFTDPDSGVTGTITTRDVANSTGDGQSALDFRDGGQSGIFGGDSPINIDGMENWGFDWTVDAQFLTIDFSALGGPDAAVQSDAWISAIVVPGSSNVVFNTLTGTFTFDGSQPGDTFSASDIWGTSDIPIISAGTDINIFSATGDGYALGVGFTFELIPEPTTFALLAGSAGLLLIRRRRR